MITFSFELDKHIPQEGEPTYTAYKNGFIEGELTIFVDDRVYFQKPSIKVAELGIYLGEWMEHVQYGQNVQMNYGTMDRKEVILDFTHEEDDKWSISSIWQEFVLDEHISTTTLLEGIKGYIQQLNEELRSIEYPVTFGQYLREERVMQLSYTRPIDSKADETVLELYNGSDQVGVIRGYYKNSLLKMLDFIPRRSSNLKYELKDSEGNIRISTKDTSKWRRRKIYVTYVDNNNTEHEIIVVDGKLVDADSLFTLTYKGADYVIHKKLFGLCKLLKKDHVIADWNIQVEGDTYRMELNVYDEEYVDEWYFVLGVLHSTFCVG
ncbi:cytoplasmic protein [Priestia taiwanensis]|uniref:Cytoplasmic protein n=1 Tax=Priestia taiwanensis TaxID=1347902 RepID=A0A917AJU7_9BACI|nr:cytoplasmic protein [Priestia taiwanensis]MBM7361929.1 hypothetical protein [Priestia taiwanensis]GGE58084.1 hypothetical protein GCM10007140_05550 [Priestia taiwanensis]